MNDHNVDLFEGQYRVPNGISYNSYIIMDDKIAIMDTVDIGFVDEWACQCEDRSWKQKTGLSCCTAYGA